jgi:hypothetical protein
MNIRKYSELIKLKNFKERFEYLKLGGGVGIETFGYDRYLNQILYRSPEWKQCRDKVIARDNGCDLGCDDYVIYGKILVHHINPITVEDVKSRSSKIFDLENLITTTLRTHNAIHYGDESLLILPPVERSKNDTCPWRQ